MMQNSGQHIADMLNYNTRLEKLYLNMSNIDDIEPVMNSLCHYESLTSLQLNHILIQISSIYYFDYQYVSKTKMWHPYAR